MHQVYRDAAVELTVSRDDLRAAAVLAVVGFAVHWRTLFLPLGGDELYHAERSALLVKRLQAVADFSTPLTHEWVQASMWRLHDVRFMPVADLWRTVSLALLAAVGLAAWLGLHAGRARGLLAAAALVAFGALGLWVRWAPEPHPPLRLLPWFASQTLLGLSDFAFRVPALALALGIQFLPVVLIVSDTVEASAFALVVWMSVLVLGHLAFVDTARAARATSVRAGARPATEGRRAALPRRAARLEAGDAAPHRPDPRRHRARALGAGALPPGPLLHRPLRRRARRARHPPLTCPGRRVRSGGRPASQACQVTGKQGIGSGSRGLGISPWGTAFWPAAR